MLFEPHCTIAIVGNSASEVGLNNGSVIDAHDYVIRFNNFSVSPVYAKDYGQKANVWACSFNNDVAMRGTEGFKTILCPYPLNVEKYRKRYGATHQINLERLFRHTTFVPVEIFSELLTHLPDPSSGISLLFWLSKQRNLFRKDIFGFSFFSTSFKHHYFDEGNYCYHTGLLERELFNSITYA